ncbi:hypothetical protein, partial [Klebsiella pneumoniae]|uniref:hypothetical protein n=1 Tax=Klebsiella pneumoniae TaxID=573 RepID=UPI001967225C
MPWKWALQHVPPCCSFRPMPPDRVKSRPIADCATAKRAYQKRPRKTMKNTVKINSAQLVHADSLEYIKTLPDNSLDAI